MDIDLGLLSCIFKKGDKGFLIVRKIGVREEMLNGAASLGFRFLSDFFNEHETLPSIEYFSAKTQIVLPEIDEKVEVVAKEVIDRYLWKRGEVFSQKISSLVEQKKPSEIIDTAKSFTENITQEKPNKIVEVFDLVDDVIDFYKRAKSGDIGILTPWPALNRLITGFQKREFSLVVARTGVGKTYMMLLLARYAHMQNYRVLFVPTEMEQLKMAVRFFGVSLHIEPRTIIKGEIGDLAEQSFIDGLNTFKGKKGFGMLEDDFDMNVESLDDAIIEYRPDIVFIDGLYLMRTKIKGDRRQRVSHVADEMTRIAKRRNVCMVASHQFNRDFDEEDPESITTRNVGISDVINWNATNIIALFQNNDMVEDKEMLVLPLKTRDGRGKQFYLRWNFDLMNFDQIKDDQEEYEDAGFENDSDLEEFKENINEEDFSDDVPF